MKSITIKSVSRFLNTLTYCSCLILIITIIFVAGCEQGEKMKPEKRISAAQLKTGQVIAKLKEKFGEQQAERIEPGVKQVAALWTEADGGAEQFAQFCEEQFINDPEILTQTFQRYEKNLEQVFGLSLKMQLILQEPIQLDMGRILPADMLFANFDPFAHINDDFFKTKIAFTTLLNFPLLVYF